MSTNQTVKIKSLNGRRESDFRLNLVENVNFEKKILLRFLTLYLCALDVTDSIGKRTNVKGLQIRKKWKYESRAI